MIYAQMTGGQEADKAATNLDTSVLKLLQVYLLLIQPSVMKL